MIIEDYVFGVFLPALLAGIWTGVAVMFTLVGNYPASITALIGVLVFLGITYHMGVRLIKFHDKLVEFYATTTYVTRRGMR